MTLRVVNISRASGERKEQVATLLEGIKEYDPDYMVCILFKDGEYMMEHTQIPDHLALVGVLETLKLNILLAAG